jgi:hypothetical protein
LQWIVKITDVFYKICCFERQKVKILLRNFLLACGGRIKLIPNIRILQSCCNKPLLPHDVNWKSWQRIGKVLSGRLGLDVTKYLQNRNHGPYKTGRSVCFFAKLFPTTASCSARVGKNFSATNSMLRFQNKIYFPLLHKRSSLLSTTLAW